MQGLSHPTDEQIPSAIAIKMFSFLHAHGRRKKNSKCKSQKKRKISQKSKGSREILETK